MARRKTIREEQLLRRVAFRAPQVPADDGFADRWPKLFELPPPRVTVQDRVLEPVRLSLVLGDGDWLLTLSDGILCQSLSVRGLTENDARDHLESILRTPAAGASNGKIGSREPVRRLRVFSWAAGSSLPSRPGDRQPGLLSLCTLYIPN